MFTVLAQAYGVYANPGDLWEKLRNPRPKFEVAPARDFSQMSQRLA